MGNIHGILARHTAASNNLEIVFIGYQWKGERSNMYVFILSSPILQMN